MFKLLILDKNERLNVNKNEETFAEIAGKVDEECIELIEALTSFDQEHIAEKALGVGQIVINLLYRLSNKKVDLNKEVAIHNAKLKGRGWELKRIYEIKQLEEK